MAQSNALREQPSMDEILASIRRIIDAGEAQSKAVRPKAAPGNEPSAGAATPVGTGPSASPPAPANDLGPFHKPTPPTGLPQVPRTGPAAAESAENIDYPAPADRRGSEAGSGNRPTNAGMHELDVVDLGFADELRPGNFPEPDISEVEAALEAEFNAIDQGILVSERQNKYESRFTEADNGAFREVANALRSSIERNPEAAAGSEDLVSRALTSDDVSRSVSQSFLDLSEHMAKTCEDLDRLAEDMLRPMLQDWLDNNLPSLVERLVRAEIERIARGEPRAT